MSERAQIVRNVKHYFLAMVVDIQQYKGWYLNLSSWNKHNIAWKKGLCYLFALLMCWETWKPYTISKAKMAKDREKWSMRQQHVIEVTHCFYKIFP